MGYRRRVFPPLEYQSGCGTHLIVPGRFLPLRVIYGSSRKSIGGCAEMRNLLRIAIGVGLFSISLQAATIGFSVSSLGVNGSGQPVFRYLYDLTALSLQVNQEVDIRFS